MPFLHPRSGQVEEVAGLRVDLAPRGQAAAAAGIDDVPAADHPLGAVLRRE